MLERLRFVAVVLLLFALASCRGCGCGGSDVPQGDQRLRMIVPGVPTTLDEAKALDGSEGRKVDIKKGEAQVAGGGNCGHSPACLILVPVILVEAAFPEHYRVATVKKDGKVTMEAVFTEGGAFARATVFEAGTARHVLPVRASCLGRTLGLEVSRAPVGADGKEGSETRSSIEAQIPLASAYRARIDELAASDPAGGGKCANEAMRILDAEAVPLAKDLAGGAQGDPVRVAVVDGACTEKLLSDVAQRREIAGVAVSKPSLLVSIAALPCFVTEQRLDPVAAGPALDAFVATLGSASDDDAARAIGALSQGPGCTEQEQRDACGRSYVDALRDRAPKCAAPGARAALLLAHDLPFNKDDALELVLGDKQPMLASLAVQNLRADRPEHREVARAMLARTSPLSGAAILLLAEAKESLSEPDLTLLLARLRDPQDAHVRALALEFLHGTAIAPAEVDLFREAEKKAKDDGERLSLAAVLARLGDKEAGARALTMDLPHSCILQDPPKPPTGDGGPASSALPPVSASAAAPSSAPRWRCDVGWGCVDQADWVTTPDALARFELHAAGCTDDDLKTAAMRIAKGDPVTSLACVAKR